MTSRLANVAEPDVSRAEKRFVDEAVVEKKFVVVALVVVELVPVKLAMVDEALTTAPATFANATDEICWRGDRDSKVEPLYISTFKKIVVLAKL